MAILLWIVVGAWTGLQGTLDRQRPANLALGVAGGLIVGVAFGQLGLQAGIQRIDRTVAFQADVADWPNGWPPT